MEYDVYKYHTPDQVRRIGVAAVRMAQTIEFRIDTEFNYREITENDVKYVLEFTRNIFEIAKRQTPELDSEIFQFDAVFIKEKKSFMLVASPELNAVVAKCDKIMRAEIKRRKDIEASKSVPAAYIETRNEKPVENYTDSLTEVQSANMDMRIHGFAKIHGMRNPQTYTWTIENHELFHMMRGFLDDEMKRNRMREQLRAEEASKDTVTLPRQLVKRLTKFRLCMSYNDSYFSEPHGELKRITDEMERAL
jgi:hypothetical protein